MTIRRKVSDFKHREDGSLLVFFLVSIVAVFGIVALSFDLGRRASTQTDMQSFADNVALAAAGELDGQPGAIARARLAATDAILAANETLKAGTSSGAALTLTFDPATDLTFYSSLPASDAPPAFDTATLIANKYLLPAATTTTLDADAVYVGVRLNTVDVDWMFGGIFGSAGSGLPAEAVGAVAVAGNTAFTCDVSPLMFCLPVTSGGALAFPNVGDGVQLQTTGRNAAWFPGNFGFLDVNWLAGNAAASPCVGLTPESRFQACLLARGISACFNSRDVDVQTGQRTGQEAASFNLPFGFVQASMNGMFNGNNAQPVGPYATGPHTISGIEPQGGGCNNLNPTSANQITETMPFPLDNCHATNSCANGRFGDGNWSVGRTTYVNTNYTMRDSSGTVVTNGSFFDFPSGASGGPTTRYQYYQREIERAANGGVMSQYGGPGTVYGPDTTPGGAPDTWDDYWPNNPSGLNPIIPDNPNVNNNLQRSDNGLPQCSLPSSTNVDRRVVIAAGIDCRPGYTGTVPANVPVAQYYRVFLLAPARDVPGTSTGPGNQGSISQIDVEIVEAVGGNAGASTTDTGIFREVIQLYK